MTYRGQVRHGQVIVDNPIDLPDGTPVHIEIVEFARLLETEPNAPTLAERLSTIIGKAEGMPVDAAREHDHYLYGTPRGQDST